MLDLVARKSNKGDLYLNLAKSHLRRHEWGLARLAIEEALSKGHLSDPTQAKHLLRKAHRSMSHKP